MVRNSVLTLACLVMRVLKIWGLFELCKQEIRVVLTAVLHCEIIESVTWIKKHAVYRLIKWFTLVLQTATRRAAFELHFNIRFPPTRSNFKIYIQTVMSLVFRFCICICRIVLLIINSFKSSLLENVEYLLECEFL